MYFFHFISVLYIFLFVKTALVYNSLSPLWFSSMISWHIFVHFTSMFMTETQNWKTHFSFKVTCADWSFSLHFSVLWSILIQINQTDLIYIYFNRNRQYWTKIRVPINSWIFVFVRFSMSGIWDSALQLVAFLCSSNAIIFSLLSVFAFPVLPSYTHFLFWATPGF